MTIAGGWRRAAQRAARHVERRARPTLWTALACALGACAPDRSPTAPAHPAPAAARSARAATAADNVVLRWSDVTMSAVRAARPGPPMVARAIAVTHTAIYDAWAAYDAVAVGTRLGGALRRPAAERTAANKERAISFAAHRALVDLFPGQRAMFDALLRELGYDPADPATDLASPTGVGKAAAAAVLALRHADNSNQAQGYADNTGYVPVNTPDRIVDPNRWQPLRVPTASGGFTVQAFVAPHWYRVTPFALTSGSQLRPAVLPNQYPFGGYAKQVEELLHVSAKLTDREKAIAEYWADGPASELPPGHWCLFAAWVSRRDGNTLDEDAKLFFALGNAMLDASIAAWDAKRAFDSARPITAVRFWKAGKPVRAWGGPGRGTVLMKGEEWRPYQPATFPTPPFPEFTSGHSTFSAAAATVLARFTGSDAFGHSVTVPAGSSLVEPGLVPARPVTLAWRTFSEAAAEAGISRVYGGIHFPAANETGQAMGRQIGEQVWAKATSYFTGGAGSSTVATR